MGINRSDVAFLERARRLGVDFSCTLTVGNQNLFASPQAVVAGFAEAGGSCSVETANAIVADGAGYASALFRHFGARRLDQLDANDYEGASVVHDLNTPLPEGLCRRYTLVFDGGSLEHVFNYPQGLKNCMEAVDLGGHFITATPACSLTGHGFYQISPELLYRALSLENGFEMLGVFL